MRGIGWLLDPEKRSQVQFPQLFVFGFLDAYVRVNTRPSRE